MLTGLSEDELSPRECRVLDEVDRRFKGKTFRDMIEYTHDPRVCPEWHHPQDSSTPIPISAILKSLGRSDAEIAALANVNDFTLELY